MRRLRTWLEQREWSLRAETLQRVAADLILVQLALLSGFTARLLVLLWMATPTIDAAEEALYFSELLRDSVTDYTWVAAPVTLVVLTVFAICGFYTHGRAYRSRYKVYVIAQAVTVSYLVIEALVVALRLSERLPRSVWLASGAFTLLYVSAARWGAQLWRQTVLAEVNREGKPVRDRPRNILVIGGAGYVGSILVRKLLRRGYDVTVLDALLYGDEGVRDLLGHRRFRLIDGDLRDIQAVIRAMENQDAVVHLGGLVGDPACAVNEELTLQINTAATRMIAEAARGFGVSRFVFASSCSVYGASDGILDERSRLNPVSLYAQTKIDAEEILLSLVGDRFAPTILRFATLYGLSPRPRFDLVVNLLTAAAVRDRKITIFGGDQWRPFVHVADAAKAIVLALEAPLDVVRGQSFNVGSDEQNYRIADLAPLLSELVPDLEVVIAGDDVDLRNYRVSFAKVRRMLGFQPDYGLRAGIAELKAAVENGTFVDTTDERFNNVRGLYMTLDYLSRGRGLTPVREPLPLAASTTAATGNGHAEVGSGG